jgi:hypothetical protein
MQLFNNIVSAILCVLYVMIALGCLKYVFIHAVSAVTITVALLVCVSCVMSSIYLGSGVFKAIKEKFKV